MTPSIRPFRADRLTPAYIGLVVTAGIIALALAVVGSPRSAVVGDHPIVFATFAVLLVATEARPMTYLADGGEVTASWTFAFALLFVAPAAACLSVVAATALGIDLVNGKPLARAAFNAAQFVLSLSAGILAASAITDLVLVPGQQPSLRWLIGAVVASAVAFSANSLLISVVLALNGGLPVIEMIRRSFGVNMGMDGVLLAMAPVFAIIGLDAWILVPLLLVTVWIIFRSASIALDNRHEATHDQLTGIANRRLFEDHAALLLTGAGRSGSRAGLIHLDLNGFKVINDRLGHYYGDLILREVAARLRDNRRAIDHVARLGGDEFAVLLGRIDSPADAHDVADRLRAALVAPMEIEGIPLGVGASLGVAVFPDHGQDLATLMKCADVATYEAKSSSTGVVVWEPRQESSPAGKLVLLSDLASALDAEELGVVYQPKLAVASGRITGVEVLLRWEHPTRGLVLPGRFMPQAEHTDLVTRITDFVLRSAVRQCVAWHDEGIRTGVAVNASARNLQDLRFPDRIRQLLAEHCLDPGWLELEITENAVMADEVRAASVLGHLRALGVRLSIDDFGTGYSSLATLRNLTLDAIKIDRSFVSGMAESAGDLSIVRSVIELGHNLGLGVIAEGVESVEVLDLLRELECDEFQGYLVTTPIDADAMGAWLRAGSFDVDRSQRQPERSAGPELAA